MAESPVARGNGLHDAQEGHLPLRFPAGKTLFKAVGKRSGKAAADKLRGTSKRLSSSARHFDLDKPDPIAALC